MAQKVSYRRLSHWLPRLGWEFSIKEGMQVSDQRVGAVLSDVMRISRQADAAVAVSAALNVTEPSCCGIGG